MGIKLKSMSKKSRQGLWLYLWAGLYIPAVGLGNLYKEMYYWEKGPSRLHIGVLVIWAIALVIGICLYIEKYYRKPKNDLKPGKIDNINLEILMAMFLAVVWIWFTIFQIALRDRTLLYFIWIGTKVKMTLLTILLFYPLSLLCVGCVIVAIRKWRLGNLKKSSVIWYGIGWLKEGKAFSAQVMLENVPLLLAVTIGVGCVIWGCIDINKRTSNIWTWIILLLAVVAYMLFLIRVFQSRLQWDASNLLEQIQEMADGKLDAVPLIAEDSLLYKGSQQLYSISGSLKDILEKQMKSERTKINLITNVSHDLKTPLTSMVGYIDLLKKEQLSDVAKDYVEIIGTKQEQLKHMIQDIFELSKSTSGDINLELEELDMAKLLEQTLADMEDAILESGMDIRKDECGQPLHLIGDGKKLYRVFQNLIGNALKYSLKGTRIFIHIETADEKIKVTIQNTAAYEMKFTSEEVLERFARGDDSRNTEGHGLGLAIAESFTKNMGGEFRVQIDGDQFKAAVTFPALKGVVAQLN